MSEKMEVKAPVVMPVSLLFSLKTLWLFTHSEIFTVVAPTTIFGVVGALSGRALTSNAAPDLFIILARLPRTFVWSWLNIFVFTVSNQRLPSSVAEDSINKQWCPLPSGRISVAQARLLLMISIPVVLAASWYLGGVEETMIAMILTFMYNDLGGANESYVVRNLLNACGLVCYSSGATRVASGYNQHFLVPVAYHWLAIVGIVIFTTLQTQDLRGQEGDRICNRKTAPLVLGDRNCRWTIALPVMAWSLICPTFWGLGLCFFGAPILLGTTLAFRALHLRGAAADEWTWKLWSLWICSLYFLPLCKEPAAIYRMGQHS